MTIFVPSPNNYNLYAIIIDMKILTEEIEKKDLLSAQTLFSGPMVKSVVDVEKGLLAIDAELHADLEQLLLSNGSKQQHLWGINLYPEEDDDEDFLEFDSMINLRPQQNNPSRGVEDPDIQKRITEVVKKWIKS